MISDVWIDEDILWFLYDRRFFWFERNEDGVESVEIFEDVSVVVR